LSSPEHETDAALVGRMRQGDREALAEWFARHADGVYGFAYYRVGRDADLAAEVTQETFARAMERLGKFDAARGPMIAWLRTLSRNCIRDALGARGREGQAAMWDSLDGSLQRIYDELDRAPLASDLLEAQETRDLVGSALTQLPEPYRRVLKAKYIDERSLEQIAGDQAVTVDAVKGLLKRARKAFKETFAALGAACPL
jgi:RNA polymerase sigma-70 factor (ECF subfamily)